MNSSIEVIYLLHMFSV